MHTNDHAEQPLFRLILAWASYRLSVSLKGVWTKLTAEQAATAAALSGNPTGF